MSFGRVFSTGNLSLIRVPQYWINGVKGGCKGLEYSKMLKIPLCLSTGMASETLTIMRVWVTYGFGPF